MRTLCFALAIAAPAVAAQVHIQVRDNFFNVVSAVPGQGTPHCTIQPGDQVVWDWIDFNPHSVTADDNSFDSGVLFPPDDWERTFNTPGVYDYHCILHGGHGGLGMAGSITVADVPPPCAGSRGDTNCDGAINFFDIDPFLLALFSEAAYRSQFCAAEICAADVDCSGIMNFFDIDPFLACLFDTCPACP